MESLTFDLLQVRLLQLEISIEVDPSKLFLYPQIHIIFEYITSEYRSGMNKCIKPLIQGHWSLISIERGNQLAPLLNYGPLLCT